MLVIALYSWKNYVWIDETVGDVKPTAEQVNCDPWKSLYDSIKANFRPSSFECAAKLTNGRSKPIFGQSNTNIWTKSQVTMYIAV